MCGCEEGLRAGGGAAAVDGAAEYQGAEHNAAVGAARVQAGEGEAALGHAGCHQRVGEGQLKDGGGASEDKLGEE